MRHLKLVSYLLTAAGIGLVVLAVALDLTPTLTLIGLMLAIAGVVKIAVVAVWHGFAGFGVPLTAESTAPTADARLKNRDEERL